MFLNIILAAFALAAAWGLIRDREAIRKEVDDLVFDIRFMWKEIIKRNGSKNDPEKREDCNCSIVWGIIDIVGDLLSIVFVSLFGIESILLPGALIILALVFGAVVIPVVIVVAALVAVFGIVGILRH